MAKSATLTLALLLALFEIGSCLHCYQCNTEQDPGCADPFKSSKSSVDCSSQPSISYNQLNLRFVLPPEVFVTVHGAPRYCHKIVMQSGTTVRTCLDGNPADMNHTCRLIESAAQTATIDGKKVKYCSVCNNENCNGAGTAAVSLPLATIVLIVSYLFCKQ